MGLSWTYAKRWASGWIELDKSQETLMKWCRVIGPDPYSNNRGVVMARGDE